MTSSNNYTKYLEYTAQQGDTWTGLAHRFYGNCFDYARLIMSNPYVGISPLIEEGTKLIIPVFDDDETKTQSETEGLPSWKQ